MVYAPGHFQAASQQAAKRRFRSRRERLAVRAMAVLTVVLVGFAAFSLTNHQRRTAGGCIDFNYSTMIGGAEMYRCGAQAREVCTSPPQGASIDTDFENQLYAACRKAGLIGHSRGRASLSS
jgi:hypothetical protein